MSPKRTMSSPTKRTLHFLDNLHSIFQSSYHHQQHHHNHHHNRQHNHSDTDVKPDSEQRHKPDQTKCDETDQSKSNEDNSTPTSSRSRSSLNRSSSELSSKKRHSMHTSTLASTECSINNKMQNVTRILINSTDSRHTDDGKYIFELITFY